MKNPSKRINKLVSACLVMEAESAMEADAIGFMARGLVLASMPHTRQDTHVFTRKNGDYTLTMTANPHFGLPFGALSRLLLAWITREASNKKSPILHLGKTLSEFLDVLKLSRNGGQRGDITRLREQMLRLLTTQISFIYQNKKNGLCKGDQFLVARSFELWSKPLNINGLSQISSITLSKDFFDEIIYHPIPIDLRVLHGLRRSPLQMDLYTWLTYRLSRLKHSVSISWKTLSNQFGSNYGHVRDFKKGFIKALRIVSVFYHQARVETTDKGIILKASLPHIPKIDVRI